MYILCKETKKKKQRDRVGEWDGVRGKSRQYRGARKRCASYGKRQSKLGALTPLFRPDHRVLMPAPNTPSMITAPTTMKVK